MVDSFCRSLINFPDHNFFVVLSSYFNENLNYLLEYNNIKIFRYDINKFNILSLLTGRVVFLDNIVKKEKINVAINVFGPSVWVAKCTKITGFARAHLIMPESPYYQKMSKFSRYKECLLNSILSYFFKRSTDVFFTENPLITERVIKKFNKKSITITNYYNQVFDNPNLYKQYDIPPFNGVTLLTISSYYPHKNLEIALSILEYLENIKNSINLRFVFTIREDEYVVVPQKYKANFLFLGKVDITECPSLYKQSDIVFQPTLLECFTATYPEAMKMSKPIITTDLHFARGLCENAAIYYAPLNAADAAKSIIKLVGNKSLYEELVKNGKIQLKKYDDYNERAKKLVKLCENL